MQGLLDQQLNNWQGASLSSSSLPLFSFTCLKGLQQQLSHCLRMSKAKAMQLITIQTISRYLQTVSNWFFRINLWKEMPRTFVERICSVCLIFSRPRRWPLGKQVKKLWNSLSLSLMTPLNQVWFNIVMSVRNAQKLRGEGVLDESW